jgi:hypothetical protein
MSLPAERRWRLVAYAYGLLVAAVLGGFLLGLTIQVSDSFGNLLAVQRPTFGELLRDQFWQRGYLRPLLWAQVKVLYELSGGQYYIWFRGIHVAQVTVLIVLCIRLMKPRTALDAALVPLSLAVLIGVHTFAPTVREANPINAFLTVVICCAAAANLAFRQASRWWTDVLAVALFVVAVLTVETGILVWVVAAMAYITGVRGVSRTAVLAMSACLVAYLIARMVVFDIGAPSLAERASGFGFATLEPSQLVDRFGDRPWVFYAYNVASSVSTVLFSEPKGGVWRFVYEMTAGDVHPWSVVSVLSSTAATLLLAWFVWTRRARFRTRTLEHDDRLVLLFVALLAANAIVSFPYTKSVIMSPSGVFLALAVFAASRTWLGEGGSRRLVVSAVLFAVLTCGWAFRAAGVHYNLRRTAAEQRTEWVHVDAWLARQRIVLDGADARALRDTLRRDAVWDHQTPFQPTGRWTRWFDIDW